jgi:hypothetical protein
MMRHKLLATFAAFAVGASLFIAGTAVAVTRADTHLTIKGPNGDFSGTISSPKPKQCANHRLVLLFRQLGATQNPTHDDKAGMDTSGLQGGKYAWDMGNTGLSGKFYARAPQTTNCKAGSSKTITVHH